MTDQPHTRPPRGAEPLAEVLDELCLAAALRGQLRATAEDGVPRAGVFTRKNAGHGVELSSALLPVPGGRRVEPDQRLARYINTVTDPGQPTSRALFLAQTDGPVKAWWLAIGHPDGARRVVAAAPAGGWYDATAAEATSEPTIGVYPAGVVPAGTEAIVGFLGELAYPATLRHQTPTAWVASETRMCGCWHQFSDHHLDGPAHPCSTRSCGCGQFVSADQARPGRWTSDTPTALALLGLTGSCATARHHTGPDGRCWHWVPDFLTRVFA